jgi:hypothetical protein
MLSIIQCFGKHLRPPRVVEAILQDHVPEIISRPFLSYLMDIAFDILGSKGGESLMLASPLHEMLTYKNAMYLVAGNYFS